MLDTKKRLAVFLPSLRGGGAERSILKLATGIAERGYAVDLVLTQAEGPYLAEVSDSLRLVDLKSKRALTSLPALVSYLHHERPEAMLSAMNYTNIIALWAQRLSSIPKRLVINEQNNLSTASSSHTSSRRGRLLPGLVRRFYPWAHNITAVSQGVADDLSEIIKLPCDRIQVVHNPVVTSNLQEQSQAPLEHPWFEHGQPPVLLAVGRLSPQKDFPTLIEAFAQVRQTRPVRLLILGEGQDRDKLETLINKLDLEQQVSLPGWVDNPYPYMVRSSLFILSSRWEGLPTVLIEALYCGTPLIATDCPSGPREILAGGKYGKLVPIGDIKAMSQAIETTLANPPAPLPASSWHPYELQTIVSQYLNLLLEN